MKSLIIVHYPRLVNTTPIEVPYKTKQSFDLAQSCKYEEHRKDRTNYY